MSGNKFVYVYSGEGSSPDSEHMLFNALTSSLVGCPYSVQLIKPDQIKEGGWRSSAALLALGGGFDLGYKHSLGMQGIDLIQKYVQDGGAYLGICAGGYFGCKEIEFDKGGPMEVCGGGRLGLYPGKCVGPAFPGFKYNSEVGAHASLINRCVLQSDEGGDIPHSFYCYFNGGGHFVSNPTNLTKFMQQSLDCAQAESESHDIHDNIKGACRSISDGPLLSANFQDGQAHTSGFNIEVDRSAGIKVNDQCLETYSEESSKSGLNDHVEVIATYEQLPGSQAAIVKCFYGKGVAVLSGVHFEYDPNQMDLKNPNLKKIIPLLMQSQHARLQYITSVLKHLRL